ncbi:hypothetical protein ES703_112311 [subsurface metagenome]
MEIASKIMPRASSRRFTRMIMTTALGDIFIMALAVRSIMPITDAAQVKIPANTTRNIMTELVTLASTRILIRSRHDIDR